MTKKIYFLTFLVFLFSFNFFCETITFSADSLNGIIGDKSDSTTLNGNAYVLTESMEISADKITMSGKDFRYITAEGSITGKNMESELEFTCQKLNYDRETKKANLSTDVSLTDIKNNVTAKAQLIEYDQNTDIAIMQIDIELTQKDNVCKGVYAIYRKNEQLLELSGNAQIKQGDDTFRAQEITLNLESQEITLDGRVKGSIIDERNSNSQNTNSNPQNNSENQENSNLQENQTSNQNEQSSQNEQNQNDSLNSLQENQNSQSLNESQKNEEINESN